jgi:hypothetical protein
MVGAEAGRSLGVTRREVVDSFACLGGNVLKGGGAAGCENESAAALKGWPEVGSVGDELEGGLGGDKAGAWALIGNKGTGGSVD